MARLKGLDSVQTTFLWRLLHQLLPLQSRLHYLTRNSSPFCPLCVAGGGAVMVGGEVEETIHAFFQCKYNESAGEALLRLTRLSSPNITPEKIVKLDFNVDPVCELPLTWLISSSLELMWSRRKSRLKTSTDDLTSHLHAKLNILNHTTYKNTGTLILNWLDKI